MNEEIFSRTKALIGEEKFNIIKTKKVAIFGIGGVGSFCVEGLVRAGIQKIVLIDHDKISPSNLNRQIHSLQSTIGKYKVDVMKQRILEINPDVIVETHKEFYLPDTSQEIKNKLFEDVDYIIDAIDTVTAKIDLIQTVNDRKIPIISACGTGNKLDPTRFEVEDIYKTTICPLAKVLRKELKKRNIEKLKVVYSKEEPIRSYIESEDKDNRKVPPASISFVPSVVGMIIASEVIKDMISE